MWFLNETGRTDSLSVALTAWPEICGTVYGAAPGSPSGQQFDSFTTAFKAANSQYDELPVFTAHTYDAVMLLAFAALAHQDNPLTGAAFALNLRRLNDPTGVSVELTAESLEGAQQMLMSGNKVNVTGASGPLDFDAVGDPPGAVDLWWWDCDAGAFKGLEVLHHDGSLSALPW